METHLECRFQHVWSSCRAFQRDLEIENIVDDMLKDLDLTDGFILRDARDQLLQTGVAVVHVVQRANRLLTGTPAPADGQTLLRDTTHSLVATSHGANRTDRLHFFFLLQQEKNPSAADIHSSSSSSSSSRALSLNSNLTHSCRLSHYLYGVCVRVAPPLLQNKQTHSQ